MSFLNDSTKMGKADDPAQETIDLVLELEMDERSGGYIVHRVVTGAPSRTS